MAFHQINGVKIHTSFDYPPIPVRNMDWSAVTDDYDADCDQDGFFSTSPVGHGATEQDAITGGLWIYDGAEWVDWEDDDCDDFDTWRDKQSA